MYVHEHWGYRHPYAARTWSREDWRGYAAGLQALGFTAMMVWPMLDSMPDPPTPSDIAHLEKMRDVIDMLHDLGMAVFITMGPNVRGNAEAAQYTFEERPYFRSDQRLDPADAAAMDGLYRFRRGLVRDYFSRADGFVIIDSDPGGWIGSTNAEFVAILRAHLAIFADAAPQAYLYYWMWIGWETYNNFWADALAGKTRYNWGNIEADCEAAVRLLLEHPEERWRLFCCMNDVHKPIIARLGVQDRTLYNPYALIELEPSFPMTNYQPERLRDGLAAYDRTLTPLGVMANAQTHVLQLPNTYLWSHLAQGGTLETADVAGFAEQLVPGQGALLAEAWAAMGGEDTTAMRQLSWSLQKIADQVQGGPLAGLLFDQPAQCLDDLALQLLFRADLLDLAAAHRDGGDWRARLRPFTESWDAWQQRTGFEDAFYGPLVDLAFPAFKDMHDPAVDQAIYDNESFTDPTVRHGVVRRLMAAVQAACG
jgi:hypothetical protein